MSMLDEELMLKYQGGDLNAMDELISRYKNPVYHFAYRLSQNNAEAEEIAQEVFFRLHCEKDNYIPSGKFRTWVFSITHNLCISRLRKKKWEVFWPRQHDDPEELAEFKSMDPSPQDEVIANETRDVLKKYIHGLPFLQKEALLLREYENLDYQEIAKILKKSLGTVKTLIYRARQGLKDKLLPYFEELKGGYNG